MQNRVLYIFITNCNSFELRGQWGTMTSCWIRLYALIFLKTKAIHKIASRNDIIATCSYQISLWIVVYHHHL